MTPDERMAWLAENPITSRWDDRGGRRYWTVWHWCGQGNGPSFEAALDEAIGQHRAAAERHRRKVVAG